MSDIYVIGTLSRETAIKRAAIHYLKLGYSVAMVTKQPDKDKDKDKDKEELIMECYKNIKESEIIVVVPHEDGTIGEGTQYEIAFAKYLGKKIYIWNGLESGSVKYK